MFGSVPVSVKAPLGTAPLSIGLMTSRAASTFAPCRAAWILKIVLQVVVFGIPGGLVQDAGGIIPFPFSLHGVPGQVRAAQVDAKQRLPVADIFVGFKIHLPAGAAVKLGENPFFIQLSCHGIHLFCGPVALIVFSKNVYAGVVHIFIEAHEEPCMMAWQRILV
ncbi:MAG: hypothetical protein ACLVLH_13385 [Eisenbergiella massiliensis]